jgi:hypothetical protein
MYLTCATQLKRFSFWRPYGSIPEITYPATFLYFFFRTIGLFLDYLRTNFRFDRRQKIEWYDDTVSITRYCLVAIRSSEPYSVDLSNREIAPFELS